MLKSSGSPVRPPTTPETGPLSQDLSPAERRALASWRPKRGCGDTLVPAQSHRVHSPLATTQEAAEKEANMTDAEREKMYFQQINDENKKTRGGSKSARTKK